MKKALLGLLAVAVIATPAFAGRPEFDAVGDDSSNVFNTFVEDMVMTHDGGINSHSAFVNEYFYSNAGDLAVDPCFGAEGYETAYTDAYNTAEYEWQIVLQMKPTTDLNLNIRDCVMTYTKTNIWADADQTGRYFAYPVGLVFQADANPTITVQAYPGPYANSKFTSPVILDARSLPYLAKIALQDAPFTSKGLWDEGLVLELPKNGGINASGQTWYDLKQGDIINVKVVVPENNTVDIRYGSDNVVVKYVGLVNSEYFTK